MQGSAELCQLLHLQLIPQNCPLLLASLSAGTHSLKAAGAAPRHCITWPTDSGFDARPFQHRHSVDGTLDVLHKNIPVQVKEAEGKFL